VPRRIRPGFDLEPRANWLRYWSEHKYKS